MSFSFTSCKGVCQGLILDRESEHPDQISLDASYTQWCQFECAIHDKHLEYRAGGALLFFSILKCMDQRRLTIHMLNLPCNSTIHQDFRRSKSLIASN
jgi:hypothetical protein